MAVQIPVLCPRCETVLNLLDQTKLGSWVKCASCEQVFVAQPAVPMESIMAQTRAEPAPASRPPVRPTEPTAIDHLTDDFSESEFDDDTNDDDDVDADLISPSRPRAKVASRANSTKPNLRVKTGKAKKAKGQKTGNASMIPLVLAVIGLSIVVVVQLVVIIVLVSTRPDSRSATPAPTSVAPPMSSVPVSPAPTPPRPATPANLDVGRE